MRAADRELAVIQSRKALLKHSQDTNGTALQGILSYSHQGATKPGRHACAECTGTLPRRTAPTIRLKLYATRPGRRQAASLTRVSSLAFGGARCRFRDCLANLHRADCSAPKPALREPPAHGVWRHSVGTGPSLRRRLEDSTQPLSVGAWPGPVHRGLCSTVQSDPDQAPEGGLPVPRWVLIFRSARFSSSWCAA